MKNYLVSAVAGAVGILAFTATNASANNDNYNYHRHGHGHGRWWHGRWWGYGVGSCWRWTPYGYVWICY